MFQGVQREEGASQAGTRWPHSSARASGTRLAYWHEVEDGAVAIVVGSTSWAGPARPPGKLGRFLPFFYFSSVSVFFLFLLFCFELVKILIHF